MTTPALDQQSEQKQQDFGKHKPVSVLKYVALD
jgi:hypothetical protein